MGSARRAICVVVGGLWAAGCGDNLGYGARLAEVDAAAETHFPIGAATREYIEAGIDSTHDGAVILDATADAPPPLPDAAVDAPPPPPPDAPPKHCDFTKAFNAPVPLAALNTSTRDIQAMSPDGTAIYFASNRAGTLDLYTSIRNGETYSTPASLAGFATTAAESSPYVSDDGLTLVYGVVPSGASFGDLYIATRASQSVGWSTGTLLSGPSSASEDDGDPGLTGDAALLYFASQRGTSYDLYVSARMSATTYSAPQLVTELNTGDYDAHPRVTSDGLTIYWSSMRTDGGHQGGADVWTASRSSIGSPFGTATRVAELNTASNESPTWISSDGCVIYLQSNRAGGAGDQDIWVATKPL